MKASPLTRAVKEYPSGWVIVIEPLLVGTAPRDKAINIVIRVSLILIRLVLVQNLSAFTKKLFFILFSKFNACLDFFW
jgi:hypothetical protein